MTWRCSRSALEPVCMEYGVDIPMQDPLHGQGIGVLVPSMTLLNEIQQKPQYVILEVQQHRVSQHSQLGPRGNP